MMFKSAEYGRAANGILSIFGAVVAFTGLIQSIQNGQVTSVRNLFLGGAFVFGASVVRVLVTSFVAGKYRRGVSLIALVVTLVAGALLLAFHGSAWTFWSVLLLALAPVVQDLLTPGDAPRATKPQALPVGDLS